MFSKLWALGAVAAVVAVLVGGSSFAAASGRGGEDTDLRLLEIRTAVVPVDLRPTGQSAGDEVLLSGRLRDASDTRTVGSAQDECTLVSTTSGALHCETTVTLKGGTLEASGLAYGGPFTFAIIGGTGAYDQARGQLDGSAGPNGTTLVRIDIDD